MSVARATMAAQSGPADGRTQPSFADWTAACVESTERALEQLLPPADELPASLHAGMRYAVLGNGKRVRPLLVFAAGQCVGAPAAALEAAACGVELIHAYSLVHDDLPCMDDDVLRRGKPTVHVAFGEATAMLVGDALQALAFEAVTTAAQAGVPAAAVLSMAQTLACAAGSRGMAGGQSIDLDSVGVLLDRPALEAMHQRKTGALLRAAVAMGAACGRAPTPAQRQALADYAQAIGLAFQVVDDILDASADSATLGKTAGKDALQEKPTYVSVLGLAPSRQLAADLRAQAHRALDGFDAAANRLRELADLIVLRKS